MFPSRYYAPPYFTPRYWPGSESESAAPAVPEVALRLAYYELLETTMAYVDEAEIRLSYDNGASISMSGDDTLDIVLSCDTLEHLKLNYGDTILVTISGGD